MYALIDDLADRGLDKDVAATLFHTLGVPPQTRLGADGFTLPASTGQVIEELLCWAVEPTRPLLSHPTEGACHAFHLR